MSLLTEREWNVGYRNEDGEPNYFSPNPASSIVDAVGLRAHAVASPDIQFRHTFPDDAVLTFRLGEPPLAANTVNFLVSTFRTPRVLTAECVSHFQEPLDSGTTATRTFAWRQSTAR